MSSQVTGPSLLTLAGLVSRSLSSHALAALAEFHAEKDAHEKTFEKLRTGAAPRAGAGLGVVEPEDEDPVAEDADDQPLSMAAFTEDWNESQFWVRKTTCTNNTLSCSFLAPFGSGGGDRWHGMAWHRDRLLGYSLCLCVRSWGIYYVLAWPWHYNFMILTSWKETHTNMGLTT